ncbi:10117_t:CDS:2, partial [Cetraspora pellucida]
MPPTYRVEDESQCIGKKVSPLETTYRHLTDALCEGRDQRTESQIETSPTYPEFNGVRILAIGNAPAVEGREPTKGGKEKFPLEKKVEDKVLTQQKREGLETPTIGPLENFNSPNLSTIKLLD